MVFIPLGRLESPSIDSPKSVQHSLAEMAAILLTELLIPAWRQEDHVALGGKARGEW